jgi:hypothetical protein
MCELFYGLSLVFPVFSVPPKAMLRTAPERHSPFRDMFLNLALLGLATSAYTLLRQPRVTTIMVRNRVSFVSLITQIHSMHEGSGI